MRKENEEEFFNLAQLKKEIEKLMKTLISLVLTFIMSLTSTSIFWTSVDFEKLNSVDSGVKETPVAYIENDDYVPYQYRNYTQDDTTTREYLDFNLNTEFETVFKTITVMTTATGDPKRGNYVASKPIADALVRVDGVPRYTDSKGQITAPLNREYVELYVEYSGYNPYIEIIEATEEQKTVYLKQPSDDIEIIDVMFNLQGYVFNIMLQPCYYLKGQMETAALLEVHSNVEYDYILFYVNGQLDRIGFDDILFTEDDLNDYDVDDEFAVSIGEGKYFTVSFIPHLNESSYLTVTTVIEGRDEVELAKDECKILVKYTDLDVDFSRNISNGKQHFEVSIKNVSDIDTSFDITVYVNGEINRKMSRKLNAFDECMYDFTFDEIAEGDYIFIEVVAMEKEFSIIDNSKGYYSLRTEKLQPPEVENPYQNILKNIKALVS